MGQLQSLYTYIMNTQVFTTEQQEPTNQGKINQIAKKFLFGRNDINKLHEIFRQMDKKGTGYIEQKNLFDFLDEDLNSILSPYIEYLFQLIEKEVEGKISFSEWLPAISLYCLYSKDSIIGFVFKMLDNDHDNFISKKDLMTFLIQRRDQIYYYNFIKAIELLDIERPDQISLEQFKKIQTQIPFICYPAYRLQKQLKYKIFGNKYWDQLYDRILHKENEDNKLKQMHKIQEDLKMKQQIKIDKKIEKFLQNTNHNNGIPSLKSQKHTRIPKRHSSDSNLPINFDTPEELIQNVCQQLQKQSKGSVHQKKQLKMLRNNSISQQYIKLPLKLDDEKMRMSNQFIKSQTNINVKTRERKPQFQAVKKQQTVLKINTSKSVISDDSVQ